MSQTDNELARANARVQFLEEQLRDCQLSKVKLLKELIFMKKSVERSPIKSRSEIGTLKARLQIAEAKNAKYESFSNEISSFRKEFQALKDELRQSDKSESIIQQLREENDQLSDALSEHLDQQNSNDSSSGEAQKLKRENENLRRALAEQNEASDEAFEKAEKLQQQLFSIKEAGITLTLKEAYIALRKRLRQLIQENDDLSHPSEKLLNEEEEDGYDEETVVRLRQEINKLEDENAHLVRPLTPRTEDRALLDSIDSLIKNIGSLQAQNSELKKAAKAKNIYQSNEVKELQQVLDNLQQQNKQLKQGQQQQQTSMEPQYLKLLNASQNLLKLIKDAEKSDDYSIGSDDEDDEENHIKKDVIASKDETISHLRSQIEHLQTRLDVLDRKEAPEDSATLYRENRELRETVLALKNQIASIDRTDVPILNLPDHREPAAFAKGFTPLVTKHPDNIEEEDTSDDNAFDNSIKASAIQGQNQYQSLIEEEEEDQYSDGDDEFKGMKWQNLLDNDDDNQQLQEEEEEEDDANVNIEKIIQEQLQKGNYRRSLIEEEDASSYDEDENKDENAPKPEIIFKTVTDDKNNNDDEEEDDAPVNDNKGTQQVKQYQQLINEFEPAQDDIEEEEEEEEEAAHEVQPAKAEKTSNSPTKSDNDTKPNEVWESLPAYFPSNFKLNSSPKQNPQQQTTSSPKKEPVLQFQAMPIQSFNTQKTTPTTPPKTAPQSLLEEEEEEEEEEDIGEEPDDKLDYKALRELLDRVSKSTGAKLNIDDFDDDDDDDI